MQEEEKSLQFVISTRKSTRCTKTQFQFYTTFCHDFLTFKCTEVLGGEGAGDD